MGATARMQYCDLRVNHSFSDFEDQAGRIGVLYGNEVCSESARHGAAKQSLQLCVCGLEIFRNELTSSRSLRAAALMSIPDANRLSGSPVLRSPEQEIALLAVICTQPVRLVAGGDRIPGKTGRSRRLVRDYRRRQLAESSCCRAIRTALFRLVQSGPRNCSTVMPDLTAKRGSWAARLCRVGQTRNRHGLTSRRSANLTVIDLGRELCELSAGEWLAGRNISFDMVSLIAAGGSPPRLGRMGSGSTLLSSEEIEASERVRAMGKLAIYTHKPWSSM